MTRIIRRWWSGPHAFISASRLTDVLGGYALGLAWMSLVMVASQLIDDRTRGPA